MTKSRFFFLSVVSLFRIDLAFRSDCPCVSLSLPDCVSVVFTDSGDTSLRNLTCAAEYPLCFPSNYGMGQCSSWDHGLGPFCSGDNMSPWCSRDWCFVNETQCKDSKVSYFKANTFPFGSTSSCLPDDLYFSFETCNSNTSFLDSTVSGALRGKHLKIALPALQNPLVMRVDSSGVNIPAAALNEFNVF
jgi:hypothetical protein